jgi:rubrerythrin
MPDFANPFAGKVPDRKLTPGELVRAIRLDLAAEEEAIHQYLAQADVADNPLARDVLTDVANEERQHAGEFLRLLQILTGDEDKWLADGAAEVDKAVAEAAAEAAASEPAKPTANSGEEPTIGSLK